MTYGTRGGSSTGRWPLGRRGGTGTPGPEGCTLTDGVDNRFRTCPTAGSSLDRSRPWADTFAMGVSEELRALAEVVDRLAARFPGLSREQIEDVVQQEHRLLDTGRVRAFVPVLVEHAARDRLAR
ncbi:MULTISPECIES: three-helix bundle dimerization domain-containing protein [unclassified Arthrobacter]|uniref:three-helix bundle dimerization domain-containing protein n=1 Tax=unclassified Arthrobacter TaxID=235627 RepID=UPI0021A3AF1E|nr:hypothetical protein [Arthrobacter sp. MAHUQ-56]